MRVAEQLLPPEHRLVARRREIRRRIEIFDVDEVRQPLLIRMRRRQVAFDLLVVDDATLGRVDQEDPARVQPLLEHDVFGRYVEDADFRRHDHAVVLRHHVARGPQAVSIEHRANHRPVGEGDRRRAVPRLHQRRVVFVKRLQLRRHRLVVRPRLGDHHQDGVRQ
jgi:hypothetical protein